MAVIVPDGSGRCDEISRYLDQAAGITDERREAMAVLAAVQAKDVEHDHVLVVEPVTIANRGGWPAPALRRPHSQHPS